VRGFPIRTSSDHGSFANSPRLIAGYNVLLRLLVPRHPPCALINLTTKIIQKDARVHCAVLKLRPAPAPSPPHLPTTTSPQGKAGPRYREPRDQWFVERYQPAVPRTHPTPSGASHVRSDPGRTTNLAVPSGPNSVPSRPLTPAATVPTRTPKGCGVLGTTSSRAGHSRCSTLEHRPPHVRQGQRAWTPPPHP
jgi:hypothetical protein